MDDIDTKTSIIIFTCDGVNFKVLVVVALSATEISDNDELFRI